jgi:hypothetical protein
MSLKVEFNLTKDDYIAFNMYYLENSATIKRTLFIHRYFVSLVFLVLPFLLAAVSDVPFMIWLVLYGLAFILWIIFYPRYFMSITKKRIIKMIDEGKNSHMFGFRSITLTETGVEETKEHGESKTAWSSIEKVEELQDYLYIFVGSLNAYIVPDRAFDNDEQKNEFLQILRGNIAPAASIISGN